MHRLSRCVEQAKGHSVSLAGGSAVGIAAPWTLTCTSLSLTPICTTTFGALLSSLRLAHLSGCLRSRYVIEAAQKRGSLPALRTLATSAASALAVARFRAFAKTL